MKKSRLFTNFFDTGVGNKGIKLKRAKKGELIEGIPGSDSDISEAKEEAPSKKNSLNYFYILSLFVFAILSFKLLDLQALKGDYFLDLSKGNRIRFQVVRAPRGLIQDSKGNPLVKNVPNFQVIIEPFDMPKEEQGRNKLVDSLAKDLEIKPEEISQAVSSGSQEAFLNPKIIKENLGQATALKLKVKYKDFPAVQVEASPTREYLNPDLSHSIGYIGRISKEDYEKNKNLYDINDYIGKSGLELSYEEYLKGKNGKLMVEVDANGRVVRTLGSEEQSEPKMGSNIQTSLNIDLQKEMISALKGAMDKSKSKAGSVVAINPKNGNILGMVSLPSFDSNLFSKGIKPEEYKSLADNPLKPLFNRAVAGTYPSGSIIKPVIASAGLEEKVITPSTSIADGGQLVIKNQYNPEIEYVFKDWKPGGHGTVNVTRAIEQSCDVFFYEVGGGYQNFKGLGATRLEKYLRLFGLGGKLGIDLPNEADGLVPTPDWKKQVKNEGWYTADNYHLSIGQGDLLATPLQAASWTATVANGGTLYKPKIVQKVTDQDGKVLKEFAPEAIRSNFINPANISIVRQGMRNAVTQGTARGLNSPAFTAGGKTGTAQYGPNNSKEHAWFVTFAPFDNPEIALAVIVEEGGEGSSTAVPVAKQILEYYFTHK